MAPKKSKKLAVEKKKTPKKADPLFPSRPKNFGIGGDIRPRNTDLSRFVKWPKYIRLQRQRTILYQRLKVPPTVNQFTKPISKNEAVTLFSLLTKYRPETVAAKKQRIKEMAAATASGDKKDVKVVNQVKYGLKHVTNMITEKKAELVVIACDTNPIELVMWMPALCRKMDVPFMIVKNKARLGTIVHKKTASCLAITAVNKEDKGQLSLLKNLAQEKFNDNAELTRKWGGGIMGLKTQAKLDKRAKALAIEEAKKAATSGLA
eukprot:CAMPEP_0172479234 /NCGR_PEP_ID=MMETSP1066-20121228/3704_1 /TAXON_ID=671091 /ORGANISM="Coscinodiscus wailesii, Strain CCMP2513" /LENGTH=262 /DNA_ID=CAMNT_0013239527 /DNA_START=126 /DNA_END=914 /DNA_ORIENTATION=+